ncbi:MAG: hypothetical protein C5B51_05185 [Terriglobia bacterium]|nr:MAG: hypothetical protein C5B51_05185 [Terriglobia bacterium]
MWLTAPVVDNLYFGGKLIRTGGKTVAVDRLGTIRADSAGGRFATYPYGGPRTGSTTFAGMYDPDRGYNNQTAMWGQPDRLGMGAANPRNPTSGIGMGMRMGIQ